MSRVTFFMLFPALLLAGPTAAGADETDNFTCRGWQLRDSLQALDGLMHARMEAGVARANARLRKGVCDDDCFGREMQAAIAATHRKFPTGIPHARLEQLIAQRDDIDRCGVKFRDSIYGARRYNQPWLWPFTGRIIFLAESIRLDGTLVGLDKVSHFIREGLTHWRASQKGLTIAESIRQELGPARRHFGWTEYGLKGWSLTGVLSYADLAAGYWGFRFWSDVLAVDAPNSFVSRETRTGRFFIRRAFTFARYVNAAWDESLNCSRLDPELAREVAAALATRSLTCPVSAALSLAALPDAQLYVNPDLLSQYERGTLPSAGLLVGYDSALPYGETSGSFTRRRTRWFRAGLSHRVSGAGYQRLLNKALGESLSIDVVNDGVNNKLQLAATGERTGQHWLFTAAGNGFFRLTTQWQGVGRSLDVVNDGVNRAVQLAASGSFSGQFWKISLTEPGYYRLTSQWLGESRSLAAVRAASGIQLVLADTTKDASQLWKIVAVSSSPSATSSAAGPSRTPVAGTPVVLSGFQIMVNRDIAGTEQVRTTLDLLSKRLQQITSLLKPAQIAQLQKIPIWIEYKRLDDGAMWYHPNRDWLVANGYPASMEKSIEIKNVSNFLNWQADQPMMVLHEFAHAYSDLFIPQLQTALNAAFDAAARSGKYESVAYVGGGRRKAYAMNNRTEYFAELTEAYFGRNDYFPFTREDLRVFDPGGFKLMQDAWQ